MKFNQKKFVKRFVMYSKTSDNSPENSTDEFNFYPAILFDGKSKTGEDIEDFKKKIQWKTFVDMGGFSPAFASDKPPEARKFFRKMKKSDGSGNFATPGADLSEQEKSFWKISKLQSLPMTTAEISARFASQQNANMLWRSLEHIQHLYDEGYVHQVSEIIDVEFEDDACGNGDPEIVKYGNREPGASTVRKARLSRWNFLRYDGSGEREEGVKSYFARGKNFRKSDEINGNDVEDFQNHGRENCSSNTAESCTCSCCSCDTCTNGSSETATSQNSRSSKEKMAPNSEEDFQSKRAWETSEFVEKESLRPPVYNPEDYATSLKKWGRKTNAGIQIPLYLSQSTGSIEKLSPDIDIHEREGLSSMSSTKSSSGSSKNGDEKPGKKEKEFTMKGEKKDSKNKENAQKGAKNDLNVDLKNPILALSTQEGEMSLRQFSSVTELLGKLQVDLKLSFPSFVQEFVGDPVDGVTLLLELLRAVQLSQASQQQRRPPQIFRRALLDEHSCLVCLKHCLRCSDATRRLASSSAGLFTLAVCIMSNVTQSRIIALELLTKACEIPGNGHKAVSEALSTLRLRFGEPVRFRFLVGMLNSAGTIELLAAAMKFINVFVDTAPSIQQKVYIQAELEQAGFEAKSLRKTLPCNSESVKVELNRWEKNYLDVENLQNQMGEMSSLHEKIQLLEKKIEILQEEKGILQSLEKCLKERCSELEEEMSIKTNTTTKTPSTKPFHNNFTFQQGKRLTEKGESTPAEDEGISSSEQELSQDEDYIKAGGVSYDSKPNGDLNGNANHGNDTKGPTNGIRGTKANTNAKYYKNVRGGKMKETNVDDGSEIIRPDLAFNDEEETTIDEVIEELENIVNDAETEVYGKEDDKKKQEIMKFSIYNRQKLENGSDEKTYGTTMDRCAIEEVEIVPSLLHPQPPRKAKSLIHIYLPRRDFDSHDHEKHEFFDEDTDTESSDSLLTATREKRSVNQKSCHRSLNVTDSFGTYSSTNTRTLFIKQEDDYEGSELNVRMSYEERNIDEEELKRRHLKLVSEPYLKADARVQTENFSSPIFFKDNKFGGESKKPVFQKDFLAEKMSRETVKKLAERELGNARGKTTSFQEIQNYEKPRGDEEHFRKTQNYESSPVKRSQTFHWSTSDGNDMFHKRVDMKPKPKMGVSGIDFQRNAAEQKMKSNEQSGKHQIVEYKKNSERKPDSSDRYSKKIHSKDPPQCVYANDEARERPSNDANNLCRRGSFDGAFFPIVPGTTTENGKENKGEISIHRNCSPETYKNEENKPNVKIRSKSLEKMDEGLNSLVDIVIAKEETRKAKPRNESNGDPPAKNIGPRTRRSLAESSLFIAPKERLPTSTIEESPKPPKPAQRTSLIRHNSSSTPLHLPKEIKLAPVQPNPRQQVVYNFGVKPSKSEDSVLFESKRCPPDGSSNPTEYKTTNGESQTSRTDKDALNSIYSTPSKPCKPQSSYNNGIDRSETLVNPMPRNLQNVTPVQSSPNGKGSTTCSNGKNNSKPNFLLGTYQSPSVKNIPKPSSSVMNSINNFNNTFLSKHKSNGNSKHFSSHNGSEASSNGSNHRKLNGGTCASVSDKLTDSPSGLY